MPENEVVAAEETKAQALGAEIPETQEPEEEQKKDESPE